MSEFLNTYSIATMGYNVSPASIAALGYYYTIEITEILPETPEVDTGGGIAPLEVFPNFPPATSQKKYKIKVTAIINDEKVVEEKIVKSIKKPVVKNVKIEIDENSFPKIKINLTE